MVVICGEGLATFEVQGKHHAFGRYKVSSLMYVNPQTFLFLTNNYICYIYVKGIEIIFFIYLKIT